MIDNDKKTGESDSNSTEHRNNENEKSNRSNTNTEEKSKISENCNVECNNKIDDTKNIDQKLAEELNAKHNLDKSNCENAEDGKYEEINKSVYRKVNDDLNKINIISPTKDNHIQKYNLFSRSADKLPQAPKSDFDIRSERIARRNKHLFFDPPEIFTEKKECWICLSDDTAHSNFLRPCECRGSTKYVHRNCFLDYIESMHTENVSCTFCKTKYMIYTQSAKYVFIYEILAKMSRFICNSFFIITLLFFLYLCVFLYGFSVYALFIGKQDLIEFVFTRNRRIKLFNTSRLAIGIPVIPACLILTMHKKFTILSHVLPTFILLDSLSGEGLLLSLAPSIFYLYVRLIFFIEKRCGKKEDENSTVMINEHYVKVTRIVNIFMMPYFAIVFGNAVFVRCDWRRSVKSFYGCLCYIVVRDFMEICYLIMLKRKMRNVVIIEHGI